MDAFNKRIKSDNIEKIKKNLGLFLTASGIIMACWVALNVYELFNEPHKLAPFQKVVSDTLQAAVPIINEQIKLFVPPELLSYAIPLALLLIGASVARILIEGGVRLLESDRQVLLKRLSRLQEKVERKIDVLKDSVKDRLIKKGEG